MNLSHLRVGVSGDDREGIHVPADPIAIPPFEPLLTFEEAATQLHIHVKTLLKMARASQVPCIRLGKYWMFAGEKVGLKGVGWHSLDDTGANTGTQKGLMRHANISTSMNVYGRASMKAKQEANSKVVQMILQRRTICA